MRTLANSEDPDKMPMRHFIKVYTVGQDKFKNDLQRKKFNFIWKITGDLNIFNEPFQVYYIKPEGHPLVHEGLANYNIFTDLFSLLRQVPVYLKLIFCRHTASYKI